MALVEFSPPCKRPTPIQPASAPYRHTIPTIFFFFLLKHLVIQLVGCKQSHQFAKNKKMHLMYTLDAGGNRLYTLKKVAHGQVTKSAHPARFSPDDKWSRQRVTMKKRFGLLLTQQSTLDPEHWLESGAC